LNKFYQSSGGLAGNIPDQAKFLLDQSLLYDQDSHVVADQLAMVAGVDGADPALGSLSKALYDDIAQYDLNHQWHALAWGVGRFSAGAVKSTVGWAYSLAANATIGTYNDIEGTHHGGYSLSNIYRPVIYAGKQTWNYGRDVVDGRRDVVSDAETLASRLGHAAVELKDNVVTTYEKGGALAVFDRYAMAGGEVAGAIVGLKGLGGLDAGAAVAPAADSAGADALALRRSYLDAKFGRTGDLNNDINLRGYMSRVETLNVSSAPGDAIFYSGPGNRGLAELFGQTGGTTLESTPGGAWLDNQALFKRLPPEMAIQPWDRLSQRFAQEASGSVSAFIDGASTRGTFYRVELPALQANPNVNLILRNGNQPIRLSR